MKAKKMDLLLVEVGIKKAEKYFGCADEWARRLKVKRQTFSYWKLYGVIPCEKAMETYVLSNGSISPIELRPDLKNIINNYDKLIVANHSKSLNQEISSSK